MHTLTVFRLGVTWFARLRLISGLPSIALTSFGFRLQGVQTPCKPGRLINQTCHFLQYCRLKQRSLSERTASSSAKVVIPLGSGAHFSDRPFRAASPDLQKWPFSLILSPFSASAACHRTRSGALRLCSWPPGVHVQLASRQLPPRATVAIFA